MSNIKITIEGAIKEGYKYFFIEGNEESVLDIDKGFEFEDGINYYLYDNKPNPYGIGEDEIYDMLIDSFNNQELFYDDDDSLCKAIENIDFKPITKKINKALSTVKYYTSTDIQLIP